MLILTDKLMVVVKDLYNDLALFAETKNALDNREVTERKLEFEQRIDQQHYYPIIKKAGALS